MSINNLTAKNVDTANLDIGSLGDLSAFEPEAILNALPGEHPRMASALGIGRAGSETGVLDVAALSKIVNELYAEGFPAHAPFAQQPDIPSNASLSYIATDAVLPASSAAPSAGKSAVTSTSPVETPTPSFASVLPNLGLVNPGLINMGLINPGLISSSLGAPSSSYPVVADIDITSLLGGLEIPYQAELVKIQNGSQTPSVSSLPLSIQPSSGYYFLNNGGPQSLETSPKASQFQSAHPAFDVNAVRRDFPILGETVNGYPLIWFDNAATTQKPQVVIDRISYFYQHENSNTHRAAHALAAKATDAYEEARETVRRFINAPSVDQIIFVRGTTEAINLVAKTWGKKHLSAGDEIVISHLEHHANIVPWQQLCQETDAVLKIAPVDDSGQILLNEYQQLLTSKVKLVSFTQVSNALGTVTPAQQMIEMAHRIGAKVLLDGAQSISHMPTDVQALGADFFVFSGHKVFGPTGIGVLYGKPEILEEMPAWQGGGNMIQDVTFDKTVYHKAPAKFEAGTGNIADAVGLGAALQYVEKIGIHNIARYEHELLEYATAKMANIPGLRLIGTAANKASVLSFSLKGYQSEEVGAALNSKGIAVRSGHHCAQPILRRFGVETTVRPSLAFYNTYAEIDLLVQTILHLAQR